MAQEIKVPSVGESITEVIISQWLKKEGDTVKADESVISLETDKVNVDVPAPVAGILKGLRKKAGDIAKVGEVLAVIEQSATTTTNTSSQHTLSTTTPSVVQPGERAPQTSAATAFVMPSAQRVFAEAGLSSGHSSGSGPGGRILKEDALLAVQQKNQASEVALSPVQQTLQSTATASSTEVLEQVVPMTPLRRRIAERLVQAQQQAAILTTFNEVDMTQIMALRKQYQDFFVKKYQIKLGFMSFFVKASIDALRLVPEINAEIRDNHVVYKNYYDIGVAVGTEKGLVVPILRRAEFLSFAETEKAISEYADRAIKGKLRLEDMQGGTFTISNGGVYGSLMSTPILNPPQSGILGMHGIVERPIGVQGKIELRPMMYIALSYDHRIVDGKGAVTFLKRLKDCIEEPSRMLLEI